MNPEYIMTIRTLCLITLLALAGGTVHADPQPGDTRITDPAEVTRLGFDPATDEVWRAADFDDRDLLQQRLDREALGGDVEPAAPNPLVDVIWNSVQSNDFHFRGANAEYRNSPSMELYCVASSPVRTADAAIQLPNDHRATWMDVWAHDSSNIAGLEVSLWEVCQNYADASRRTAVQLAVVDTGVAATPGNVFLNKYSGPNRWVRNATCSHMVRASWSSCGGGDKVLLRKVRVLWDYD